MYKKYEIYRRKIKIIIKIRTNKNLSVLVIEKPNERQVELIVISNFINIEKMDPHCHRVRVAWSSNWSRKQFSNENSSEIGRGQIFFTTINKRPKFVLPECPYLKKLYKSVGSKCNVSPCKDTNCMAPLHQPPSNFLPQVQHEFLNLFPHSISISLWPSLSLISSFSWKKKKENLTPFLSKLSTSWSFA